MKALSIAAILLVCGAGRATPQDTPGPEPSAKAENPAESGDALAGETPAEATLLGLVSVALIDGTTLTGRIVSESDDHITILTPAGLSATLPRSSIVSLTPVRGRLVAGVYQRHDPNYSRLMFAPTGRPLRQGDGYLSDYYVFFPGVSYGVTGRLSVTAGLSIFPGASLDQQILTLAPRYGLYVDDELAVSVGTLYMTVPGEGSVGIAFAVGSMGPPDKCLTVGIGMGYGKESGHPVNWADHPIILVGGNVRLSNSVALVSENWFITGEGLGLDQQPLAIAVRFFGERLAVDVGAIIIGEVMKEGFPIPWLSFVYHFGG